MYNRTICVLALVVLSAACASRSQPEGREPAPRPVGPHATALVFPTIDSATLASLSALLDRMARDTSLLSALSLSQSRMYALFRELEAAQERFAIALATPDSTGQTLYDRLTAMAAQADSVFRSLETLNRQAPRP